MEMITIRRGGGEEAKGQDHDDNDDIGPPLPLRGNSSSGAGGGSGSKPALKHHSSLQDENDEGYKFPILHHHFWYNPQHTYAKHFGKVRP